MIEPNFGEEIDCGSFFDNIDDLLDFSTDSLDTCFATNGNSKSVFPTIWPNLSVPSSDSAFSGNVNSADLSSELSVPYEDVIRPEWLSSFEEELFSNGCLSMKNQDSASIDKCTDFIYYQFQTSSPVSVLESSGSSVGEKSFTSGSSETTTLACRAARSKRTRPPTSSSRPAIQTSTALLDSETSVESPDLAETPGPEEEEEKKKKQKKMNQNSPSAGVRKCLHCEVTKTPQWRAGPMGPKTLCNACGVRHKSGRLFPEYRPAASPTFVPSLHSNSHKKVAEMRKKAGDDPAAIAASPKAQ